MSKLTQCFLCLFLPVVASATIEEVLDHKIVIREEDEPASHVIMLDEVQQLSYNQLYDLVDELYKDKNFSAYDLAPFWQEARKVILVRANPMNFAGNDLAIRGGYYTLLAKICWKFDEDSQSALVYIDRALSDHGNTEAQSLKRIITGQVEGVRRPQLAARAILFMPSN